MSGHNNRMQEVGKSIREQLHQNRKQNFKEIMMSLTTRRLETDLPDGTKMQPTDVYYLDHESLTDEQVKEMRDHKARLIRKYRKLAKRRIGLRCQITGKPIERMIDNDFVRYMLQHSFPYEMPQKR